MELYTGRGQINSPNCLDITVNSKDSIGVQFAPYRNDVWAVRKFLYPGRYSWDVTPMSWDRFVERYTGKMRQLFSDSPETWINVLNRPIVIGVCFCTGARCHRYIWKEFVIKTGEYFGIPVLDRGEWK